MLNERETSLFSFAQDNSDPSQSLRMTAKKKPCTRAAYVALLRNPQTLAGPQRVLAFEDFAVGVVDFLPACTGPIVTHTEAGERIAFLHGVSAGLGGRRNWRGRDRLLHAIVGTLLVAAGKAPVAGPIGAPPPMSRAADAI